MSADGQAVWFWLPDAGVKFAEYLRKRWWLKSPAHQEERGAAVKPLRRECRSDFGVPVLACVRLFVLHVRQWVRRAPGIPCALFSERDEIVAKPGREFAPRECGRLFEIKSERAASHDHLAPRCGERSARSAG